MLALLTGFLSTSLGRTVAMAAGGLVAVSASFGAGFYKGDRYRGNLDAAANAAALVAWQSKQTAAAKLAHDADTAALTASNAELAAQLEAAKAAIGDTSITQCLSPADANALRRLWSVPHVSPKR